VNDEVAQAIMKAQKRTTNDKKTGLDETPDDRTDWASYLDWFRSLGVPAAKFDDVIDHIVHAVSVAGVDHVGIGSDFDGVPALPEGLETAAALPMITARLLERGMSEEDVEKILGGNFMRVFEAVERGALR
jgi:membrane dipeptidase